MRKLVLSLLFLIAVGITLTIVSFYYSEKDTTLSVFLSNLALNVVAEVIGVFITLSGLFLVAVFFARKRFESLATPIAELVAQLRAEGTISREAARRTMICAVKIITPEYISQEKNNSYLLGITDRPCDVCALPTTIDADNPCQHCGLKKHVWSIHNKPIIEINSHTS